MSAQLAVQKAVYDLLRANATMLTLLAADPDAGSPTQPSVFDHVPQSSTSEDAARFPYVVVGDATAGEFDTDDKHGQETTVTLHVWDKYPGRKRVNQILDAIYTALHDAALPLTGQVCVLCYWEFSQVLEEEGPKNQHAVTRFRVLTQES